MKCDLKKRLLSASANALKLCSPFYHDRMSFWELHKINKRVTPTELCNYKHALLFHRLVSTEIPTDDWVDLNFQQTFGGRTSSFNFFKTNNYKIGNNILCNRFHILNQKLDYALLNENYDLFKVKCKSIFL